MTATPLKILYEDPSIIAIDKQAGHLVHAADHPQPNDVVAMKLVRDYADLKIYPTHRLDRPTCGVLLFAKNKTSARAINRAFERKQIQKSYRAIVAGQPPLETWTCSEPLQKDPSLPFKEARTDFRILASLPHGLTLLEASPQTGRYHQIRKHLQHQGLALIGDYLYADYEACEQWRERLGIGTRMLLQCQSLTLLHPLSRQELTIEAPPESCFTPDYWEKCGRALEP